MKSELQSIVPEISIIIVHYNAPRFLATCLETILTCVDMSRCEILLVDNASPDTSWREAIPVHPQLSVYPLDQNIGFGGANNFAARVAKGNFLFLLNPDVELHEDPIPEIMKVFTDKPDAGAVGPRLHHPDGSLQPSRGTYPHILLTLSQLLQIKRILPRDEDLIPLIPARIGKLFAQWRPIDQVQPVDYVTGAAQMIKKELFDRLNGFDTGFFLYFEEIDLCKRLRDLGFLTYFTPHTSLTHWVDTARPVVSGFKELEGTKSLVYYYGKHKTMWERRFLALFMAVHIRFRRLTIWFCHTFGSMDERSFQSSLSHLTSVQEQASSLTRTRKRLSGTEPLA